MNNRAKQPINFAEFELDTTRRQLRRNGEVVPLKAKTFDVLAYLTKNAGRLVTKEEILKAVWDGEFVEEANLPVQISALRKALGDKKSEPRFFINVPGKGYKFIAELESDEEIVVENLKFARLVFEDEEQGQEAEEQERKGGIGRNNSLSPFFSFSKIIGAAVLIMATAAAIWLWRGNDGSPSALKRPKLIRLTTSGRVSALALAPDGRFAVFSEKEAGGESLWLRQIETGSQTRIAQPKNLEYLGLTVSPDGNYVYASVYLENQADTPLWKIPILGGAPEEILNVVTGAAVSFSPDGRRIAYTESHRPETHLLVADASGANERTLIRAQNDRRRFPFEQVGATAWSPDGETLAVVFDEKSANGAFSGILLVDPADGSEQVLVQPRWAFVDYIAWLDAEHLVFTGFEDEWANQIWMVSRRTGELRQITNDLQKYRWLAASGGNLLTAQVSVVSTLLRADFSETAETLIRHEILRESGYISYVDWSKSGAIFYSSRTTGKAEVWRVDADGANRTQVTSGSHIANGLAISPTDGSLIFPSYQNGRTTLLATDADGRNLRLLIDGVESLFPDIAPDGTIVFQEGDYQIIRLAPNEKTPEFFAKGLKPTLSPDGRQTAFFAMDKDKWRVHIAVTATGEIIKTLDLPANVKERRMRWHPSGKFLSLIYSTGENLTLLLLSVDDGKPLHIKNIGKGEINGFAWSADGRQILYSVTDETQDAVWLEDLKFK